MLKHLNKLLFLLLILTAQGCQYLKKEDFLSEQSFFPEDDNQLTRLLRQGKRYDELNPQQQMAACKILKQDYKEHSDWQTAWLLVYALNADFKCINIDRSMTLLKEIEQKQTPEQLLKWLNHHQIKLLQSLNQLKRKSSNRGVLLKEVQHQLKQAQNQLDKLNSNIQELKAIETSINRKSQ